MKPTRLSTLAVVALACALVTWLILRAVYQSLPELPWTGIPALLLVGVAEAWIGRDVRRRIARRSGTKPVHPLVVSRMLVLAKATSAAAALVGGITLGFLVYLPSQLSAATPKHDMLTAGITLGAAVLLAAAALYLEYCCRVPADRDGPADVSQSADR